MNISEKLITILIASTLSSVSQAAVILYDDFNSANYVDNVNGDTGDADTGSYSGDWLGDTAGGIAQWNSTGLTYSGMTTTDGSLEINRSTGSHDGLYNARVDPAGAASGNVIFFSALINIEAGVNGARFGLSLSDDQVTDIPPNTIRRSDIGFTSSGAAAIWNPGGNNDDATFDDPNAAPVASTGSYAFDTTYLLVGKIEDASNWAGSNDRVTMWINPTDNVEGNNTAVLSEEVSFAGLFPDEPGITQFAFQAGTDDAVESAYLDEVRIGDSFADVVPIPEPTTFALFGLAGLAAMAGLRRRNA